MTLPIRDLGKPYDRIDVVCDRYFKSSLNTQTSNNRGCDSHNLFNDQSPFPSDFKESFLKNSHNKENLNNFLASK